MDVLVLVDLLRDKHEVIPIKVIVLLKTEKKTFFYPFITRHSFFWKS